MKAVYAVGREKVREFAAAVGETDPRFHDVEAAGDHQQLGSADDHGHGAWRGISERNPGGHFLAGFSPVAPVESAAMKASWGTSTRPTIFIRFLPSFCFSSSLRLRVISPP